MGDSVSMNQPTQATPPPTFEISEKTLKKLATLNNLSLQWIRLEKGEGNTIVIKIDNAGCTAMKKMGGSEYVTEQTAAKFLHQILQEKNPSPQMQKSSSFAWSNGVIMMIKFQEHLCIKRHALKNLEIKIL